MLVRRPEGKLVRRHSEQHLAVYDATSGARKNYCRECARPILDQAREDLGRFEAKLYGVKSDA